jgi:2-polyprenyl-3-methyl-5-hydroxy-6-metoxy-1,4-benzoquinol methylase
MGGDPDTKQAERQVAWAFLGLRKSVGTYDELRAAYLKNRKDEPGDWTDVLADFVGRGYLQKVGDFYRLTASGDEYTDTLRGEAFGDLLVRYDASQAYGHLCALLHGKNLGQFSMTTMEQLDTLIRVLGLDEHSRVLDLGCGVGRITEYISDVTGATVTGLDFAGPAIRWAQERTGSKAGRLTFVVGSMNRLESQSPSFDTIIALDTLYFATDLRRTVAQMKTLSRTPGQMGLFWSEIAPSAEMVEQLRPDKTRLADALSEVGLTFRAHDFTAAEKYHWRRQMELLKELRSEFETEDSNDLHERRLEETQRVLTAVNADRVSRHLYHVEL